MVIGSILIAGFCLISVEECDLLWDIQCITDVCSLRFNRHGDTFIQNFNPEHTQWSRRQSSRNARGIITAGHKGGDHKRLYRNIDFRRNEKDIYGRIVTIEYDPNRNAYICLIHFGDGEKRYILHHRGTIIGDTIVSST
ncbi:hypothetical protein AHAS_Ahas02G0148300 [Arachis hypogaea]